MQQQVAATGVHAWAVYADSTGSLNWTLLTGPSTQVTGLGGPGQKLYFILQSTDSPPGTGNSVRLLLKKESDINPAGTATSADTLNYRYDSFEASFTPSPNDAGNLTDVNGFGIPMAIELGYGPDAASGNPTSTASRGYGISGGATSTGSAGVVSGGAIVSSGGIWAALESAGGSGSILYYTAISSGGYVTTAPRMAISPAVAIGNGVSGSHYSAGQWSGYISALANSTATSSGNANQMQLAGYFNGAPDANNIWHNAGFYAYDVTTSGGNMVLTPGPTSQIQGTITITQADLANSIYVTLGSATVSGVSNSNGVVAPLVINTGADNQWGAVLRDFVVGFTAGYWNASATSWNAQVTAPINLTKEWNQDPTYAFGGSANSGPGSVTPAVGGFYDPYAKVFFDYTNSYGTGYSDFLTRAFNVTPLINVSDGTGTATDSNDITITLFADNDTPTGYTSQTINNYLSAGSGGYLVPSGFSTSNIQTTLDFNVGTMSLAAGTPVTIVLKGLTSGSDVRLPTITSFGNYKIENNGSGGYTTSNFGLPVHGIINILNLPVTAAPSGTGVNWYQIEVGTGPAQKIFNLYETVNTSGQILNPAFSSQTGVLAIDGLATVAGNGTGQYIADTTGVVTIGFQTGGNNTLDPSLMAIVPLPPPVSGNPLPQGGYAQPWAPVVGWRPGYTSAGSVAFHEMYDVWAYQSSVLSSGTLVVSSGSGTSSSTVSWTGPATSAATVYNGGLVFGWKGADSAAVQQQASSSTPNYYVGSYTNKIGGSNIARLSFSSVSGAPLPSLIVSGGGFVTVTADTDGNWQTVAPIQFGNGTYTVQMQEFLPTDTSFASALNSASVVQSFTVSQGATVSTFNLSVDAVTSYGVIVASGGGVTVNSGGTTSATLISAGGFEHVASGADSGSFVLSGGIHQVWAGQSATDLTVLSGGSSFVYGATSGVVLNGGAVQFVIGQPASISSASGLNSATATSTLVSSGASQYVYGEPAPSSGSVAGTGFAISANIKTGGNQIVRSGGVAQNTQVNGYQWVSGGNATGTTVSSGGIQTVQGGGTAGFAFNTSVGSGGILTVMSGGSAGSSYVSVTTSGSSTTSTTVMIGGASISGGHVHALSGGATLGATLQAGAVQKVWAGGSAISTTVQSGTSLYVHDGGYAGSPEIQSGAFAGIWGAGTVASGVMVNTSAHLHVHQAGSAIGGTILSGGAQYVYSGATESGSTVASGGEIKVWNPGTVAIGTFINSGGNVYVYSGASASGTNVNAGGTLWAWDAGTTVSSANVYAGGILKVHTSALVGNTTLYGGAVEISGGGVVSGSVFTMPGTNGGTVSFTHEVTGVAVSGIGVGYGAIDFGDIALGSATMSSWTSTGTGSGTLTLTSGAVAATVTLFGNFMAASDFTYTAHGGGTRVTDTTSGTDIQNLLAPPNA
jgi:autotransporter passenger strand-loop-strand repeat protein